MAVRMRQAIVAGAFGLAVLVPNGAAFAQDARPRRDPNPPGYDGRDQQYHGGCRDGSYGHRGMHRGYYDDAGNWHCGYHDDQGRWHDGYYDHEGRWHDGYYDHEGRWHERS